MIKRALSLLFLTASIVGFGQHNGVCGFDEHQKALFNEHPGSKEAFHEHMIRLNNGEFAAMERSASITVPVVVHVLHDGGASNISYDQILSAIDMINEDFQLLNADSVDVRNSADAPFQPLTANMGIEFKLAKIDPNGQCTNGVQRRLTASTFNANDDNAKHADAGGLDAWPRDNYFNIWVVSSIEGSGGGTTLGYAQFPQTFAGAADEFGIVIRNDRMGSIGTATSGDRTLTHEIGHCFGLLHTFQGSCNEAGFFGGGTNDCTQGGDYICDTPPVVEAQWSCVTTQNTCNQIPANDHFGTDVFDQFENFMSYSPCQYMFTEGQKVVVLDNFASIGHLQNLSDPANAVATGVNLPDALCEAEFSSSNTIICAGQSVEFADQSYFGITGRTWTFTGGVPTSTTDSAVTVTYNTPGIYSVSLEVSDGSSTVSETKTDYIQVLDVPGVPLPIHEGFEIYSSIPDNTKWFVENDDNGQTWELSTANPYSGAYCVKMNNFGVDNGSEDHLISETFDLSSLSGGDVVVFNFKYAYKKRTSANNERLRIYVSEDCGETWLLRKSLSGNTLNSQQTGAAFEPADEDWTNVDITNIVQSQFIDNLRIKFEFQNDGGNNLYLDHINLYPESMANIQEEIADNLEVYPNPVNDNMVISMDVYDAANYTISLTNTLGQVVSNVYTGELLSGEQVINYSTESLPSGIYFLNIESNGHLKTTKVIKQ
jgi:PKD repeat protein